MYFPKLALAASFITLAVATPTPAASCSTGSVQCYDSVQPASSNAVSTLLGLLGIVLQDLTVAVGLTCSPISVIGVSGSSCSAQTVCCDDVKESGLIAIGCTPININL